MKKIVFFILTFCILIMSGCKADIPEVTIHPEISEYSDFMSSVPGFPLSPVVSDSLDKNSLKFHWITKYGSFSEWGIKDYTVRNKGKNFINDGEKVYWNADPDQKTDVTEFTIILKVEDAKTGTVLSKSSIKIEKFKEVYYRVAK